MCFGHYVCVLHFIPCGVGVRVRLGGAYAGHFTLGKPRVRIIVVTQIDENQYYKID